MNLGWLEQYEQLREELEPDDECTCGAVGPPQSIADDAQWHKVTCPKWDPNQEERA